MNAHVLRLLYEALTRIGLNPSLSPADVPDTWLVELVESRRKPGRALDLGCGGGRNTRYLARQGWDATGIDLLGAAIEKARSQGLGDAAKPRFLQGDVTKLAELDLGDAFDLINDSGCYYGLPENRRDSYAAGVTQAAKQNALLLIAGFTKIPGLIPGISEKDLRRRFAGWELHTSAVVPIEEITRHTRIPFPLKAGMQRGRLQILRFELSKAGA
jgi:SAM-dependent methyltransferase